MGEDKRKGVFVFVFVGLGVEKGSGRDSRDRECLNL